jgi:hypothetical protein
LTLTHYKSEPAKYLKNIPIRTPFGFHIWQGGPWFGPPKNPVNQCGVHMCNPQINENVTGVGKHREIMEHIGYIFQGVPMFSRMKHLI